MTDPTAPPPDDLACREEVELITWDYLEGALPATERTARLEAHLEICPGCAAYVEQMRTLRPGRGLGTLREDALPGGRAAQRGCSPRSASCAAGRKRPRSPP